MNLLDDILERVASMDEEQRSELESVAAQSVGDLVWCPQKPRTEPLAVIWYACTGELLERCTGFCASGISIVISIEVSE